jgi:hypothetical protein
MVCCKMLIVLTTLCVYSGESDCADGEDESAEKCPSSAGGKCSARTQFECAHTHKCIPRAWVNDGQMDCGDGDWSDESGGKL